MIWVLAIMEDGSKADRLRGEGWEGIEVTVASSHDPVRAMKEGGFEVIIVDREDVVTRVRDKGVGCPVLLVSEEERGSADVLIPVGELGKGWTADVVRLAAAQNRTRKMAETLFDNPLEGIMILDPQNRIRHLNRMMHNLIKDRPSSDLPDSIGTAFLDHIREEQREAFLGDHGRLRDHRSVLGIYELKGSGSIVESVSSAIDLDGEPAFMMFVQDVTERHRGLEALAAANDRMGVLNKAIRHDILNQLAVLNGLVELLRKTTSEGEQGLLDRVHRHLQTIHRQIAFTRDYQDLGVEPPDWLSVQEQVASAMGSIDLKGIDVRVEAKGVRVSAAPQLQKVFLHLFENSLEHSGGVKVITVRFEHCQEGGRLIVEDDGRDIPPEAKGHMEDGMGGYGLLLVKEILSITGMSIVENGTPGEGARFEITVPRHRFRLE